mgnify:CR=1 FL=1
MIKSFQGARAPISKEAPQNIQVKDYMTTKLITFKAEQSMEEAMMILLSKKISGAPVVDEDQRLIGILSEGDCLKEIIRGKYNNSPHSSGSVGDYMTKDVHTIDPETSIFDAAGKFLNERIRRFPVVRNGILIGQISQKDVMRAFTHLRSETW